MFFKNLFKAKKVTQDSDKKTKVKINFTKVTDEEHRALRNSAYKYIIP